MSVAINKNGDIVITIPKQDGYNPFEEIELRRQAVYDAIQEHNANDFVGSDLHYGLTTILKDFDPTPQQWEKMLLIDALEE
jgi:hypothetical protein